jgi:hypothetical protein
MIPAAPGETLVLGQAKFVVGKRLERQGKRGAANAQHALERLSSVLAELALVEPTNEETAFAARLENAAQKAGLALDSGESLLCSLVVHRDLKHFATGDKRAICAMETLAQTHGEMARAAGRVLCLEQLFVRLLAAATDPGVVRRAVCDEHHVDRALTSCFSCSSPEIGPDQWTEGLSSYIESVRADAPSMLSVTVPEE